MYEFLLQFWVTFFFPLPLSIFFSFQFYFILRNFQFGKIQLQFSRQRLGCNFFSFFKDLIFFCSLDKEYVVIFFLFLKIRFFCSQDKNYVVFFLFFQHLISFFPEQKQIVFFCLLLRSTLRTKFFVHFSQNELQQIKDHTVQSRWFISIKINFCSRYYKIEILYSYIKIYISCLT